MRETVCVFPLFVVAQPGPYTAIWRLFRGGLFCARYRRSKTLWGFWVKR